MATKQLSALLTIGGAVKSSLGSAFRKTSSGLDEVGSAIRKAKREQTALAAEIARASKAGPAQVGHLIAAYDKLGDTLKTLGAKQKALREAEERHAQRVATRGRMARGAVAAGAATAATGAGARSLFSASAGFNYSMSAIGVTAETSNEQVQQMGDSVMKLARDTAQSATTVQAALGFLVASGMELDTAQRSLRAIGRTATASSAEIEDVARASQTLIDALEVKPEGLQDALDILVKSGKLGNFEFKAMAKNLPALGASFVSLQMTGREAAATMGAALQIARKGAADEEEAANNIRNLLAKILSPETLKKAKKLGVDLASVIRTAQKKGENPFEAAMAAIDKMTNGGDLEKLGQLFEDMQVQNAVKPLLQNWRDYKRIKAEALAGSGTVDRDFVTMTATSRVKLDELKNAAAETAIRLGTALEPAIVGIANALTPVVRAIGEWARENPKLAAGVVGLTVAAAALSTTLFSLGVAATFIGPGIAALGTAFKFVKGALLAVSVAARAFPLIALGTAIATAAVLIYQNWDSVKRLLVGIWDAVLEKAKPVIAWISDKLGKAMEGFRQAKAALSWRPWSANDGGGAPTTLPRMATAPAAAAGAAGGTVNRTVNVTVNAAPGQSAAQVASEVARRAGVQGRELGALHDQPDW